MPTPNGHPTQQRASFSVPASALPAVAQAAEVALAGMLGPAGPGVHGIAFFGELGMVSAWIETHADRDATLHEDSLVPILGFSIVSGASALVTLLTFADHLTDRSLTRVWSLDGGRLTPMPMNDARALLSRNQKTHESTVAFADAWPISLEVSAL